MYTTQCQRYVNLYTECTLIYMCSSNFLVTLLQMYGPMSLIIRMISASEVQGLLVKICDVTHLHEKNSQDRVAHSFVSMQEYHFLLKFLVE